MNILIGAVKHCNLDRLEVWAKSAYECFPEVKKIILCMDDEIPSNIKKLESLNFEIVHTPSPAQKNIDVMKYERHHAIAKYISNYGPTDIILATDTFDVFFQSNPFEWYESNRTNELLIGSEGITIENEHWNRGVISKAFPLDVNGVLKNDVFCAGVIMGTAAVVSDLMSIVYNYTKYIKTEDSEGVDQAALNVLLASNYFKSKLQKTTTTENFVVHCAVSGPTELFIPWGFSRNYKYDLPKFNGTAVVNKDGIPYCVVHQYNRVKEWNNFFDKKYRNFSFTQTPTFYINSENSSEHWAPFSVNRHNVLDLGCGRWFGVEQPEEYSPIWFGNNGALKVIGVDSNTEDINFYNQYVRENPKYKFIIKNIDSVDSIETLIVDNNVTALKSDIEGEERYMLDINPAVFSNIKEIAIEYHTTELREKFIKKFNDWGFKLKAIGKFSFAGDNVGVLFGSK